MKLSIYFLMILLALACNDESSSEEKPVAKVLDKYLYNSEITTIIPPNSSKEDSIFLANNYIRSWVTKELLLYKANQNLTDEEKNIRRQVEDYASSILIYKYKEKLINEKLNVDISDNEINNYYNENKFNFLLNTPIVRAQIVILPHSAINLDNFKKWFKSEDVKDQEALEEYVITHAIKYDNFNDQWVELRKLLSIFPDDEDWNTKLKRQTHIETEDEDNLYFLKIKEIRRENEVAPLSFVKNEIELILRNKEKINFEDEIERQINEEGIRKDFVKIY